MVAVLLIATCGLSESNRQGGGGDDIGGDNTDDDGHGGDLVESEELDQPSGGEVDGVDLPPAQCSPVEVADPGDSFFADISVVSGIQDQNFDPDPSENMRINDHSRLGFADINGDGYDDIVMHSLFPNPRDGGIPFEHLVFLNNGDGTFENFSDESGLRGVQSGSFIFGDVDNDGDQDLFASLDVPLTGLLHQLLLNDGSGHFTVRSNSGLEGSLGQTVAANAVFADFNGDANLDLFIGNGHTSYAANDQLFFGNGDATFIDRTGNLGGNPARPTNGSVACDYDNDGDLDIFVSVYSVSHENGHNALFENDGTGNFTNVASERGFNALSTGNYWLSSTGNGADDEPDRTTATYVGSNGFGLQCEDIDSDGNLDIYITAISHPVDSDYSRKWSDPTALLINGGPELGYSFVNRFRERGLQFNEGDVDGGVVDFDNDGLLDLSTSRDRKYEPSYTTEDQRAWFGLFRQTSTQSFVSVGVNSGINDLDDNEGVARMRGAQNHAWSDIDRDGDLDLLVGGRTGGRTGRPNFLFENLNGSANSWIAFEVEGDGLNINRDAIGPRVTIHFSDHILVRELKSSRGMHNSLDTRALHFGLGRFDGCAFDVTVRWPDGTVTTLDSADVETETFVTVRYGETE